MLFMRHPPLPVGEDYGFEIPGHDHLNDQSVNSDRLNPEGLMADVLFDTKNGNHLIHWQIACLDARSVRALKFLNEKSKIVSKGVVKYLGDVYTFDVAHDPTPCMYPHCIIVSKKNSAVAGVTSAAKTGLRMLFADIATSNMAISVSRLASERTEDKFLRADAVTV